MSKLHCHISITELSKLTGISRTTLTKDLKLCKIDSRDPISVMAFCYPLLMTASLKGRKIRHLWKECAEERVADADARRERASVQNVDITRSFCKAPSVAVRDEYAQESPEY